VVPTDGTGGGEMRLDAFFAGEGEAVDWRADAHATPATFSPLCGFRATLKRVDSGSKYGVGWYNADSAATAPPARVFPIIPRNATPGQAFTGDDIRSSPDYAGGLIGFALIRDGSTPPYHYSESQWNVRCDFCVTPGPWVLSLTYQSKNIPNAWYLGFEDGRTDLFGWSNDGDFNDSLFLFEGLTCEGGGQPCEVEGTQGVCRAGLTECVGSGTLSCKQVVQPNTEKCDGIDNDCNGSADEGDALCPEREVCHQGRCVPSCSSGEFPCRGGRVCIAGVCLDPACAEKTCDAGQACIAGECVAPCDGVVCPGEARCTLGRCVDPCAGVTCEEGRLCERGVCVESCGCRGCDTGLSCQKGPHPASGRCVPSTCLDQVCGAGEACTAQSGACAPLCGPGVVCPRDEICEAGACVPAPETGAGGSNAGTGGSPFDPQGGAPGTGVQLPPGSGGAARPSPGVGSTGGSDLAPVASGPSCGCRTATDPGGGTLTGLAGALAVASWIARRVARGSRFI
jgi:hypothetical protein